MARRALTADQKTKIRTTVDRDSAPEDRRAARSNSRSTSAPWCRAASASSRVPPTLVEIHPAWRGYMYFVVGDELVIVEPGTLKIVAVSRS